MHKKSDRYRDLQEGGNLVPWINLPFQPQKPLHVHSDDSLQKEIKRTGWGNNKSLIQLHLSMQNYQGDACNYPLAVWFVELAVLFSRDEILFVKNECFFFSQLDVLLWYHGEYSYCLSLRQETCVGRKCLKCFNHFYLNVQEDDGVVTTQLFGRVGDPSLSTCREIGIHRNFHGAGMVSHMQQHHKHCYFQRTAFSPSIEQDYDPEWVSSWKCDRDAPKDTLQSRQRLVEQTCIVIPIWDKGFICVNHILLLLINSITALAGNHFIIPTDNANTGTPFPGTSPSWRWLHSPCQMSKLKCLLQSWLPECK